MDIEAFRASLDRDSPPTGLPALVEALWWEACGAWDRAHGIAQHADSPHGALVHAYLHRREGDTGNAAYWYRRAGRPVARGALDAERLEIAAELLG